jgi:hypothetical protein
VYDTEKVLVLLGGAAVGDAGEDPLGRLHQRLLVADLEVALAASSTGQVDRGDAGLGQPRGLCETLLAALFLMGHEDFSG